MVMRSFIPWERVKKEFEEKGEWVFVPSGQDIDLPAPDGYLWQLTNYAGSNIVLIKAEPEA